MRITDPRAGQNVCFSSFANGVIYDAAFPKKNLQTDQKNRGCLYECKFIPNIAAPAADP
jgi:hypothetical protein